MLSRETSDWSLKRRGDSLGEEQFGDFEEDRTWTRTSTTSWTRTSLKRRI